LSDPDAEVGWVQIRIPEERSEQARRVVQIVLREPFQKRSWAELGYFLAASALAGGAVIVLGTIGFVGLVLTVVLVGVLILGGGLRIARGLGRWQRTLAWATLGEDIAEPEPFSPAPGVFRWLRAALSDGAAWRSVLYFAAKVPLTLFGVWFALSLWVEAILGIASPVLGGGGITRFGLLGHAVGTAGATPGPPGLSAHVTEFAVGVFFLFLAPWTMRFVVYVDRRLMRLLLGPNATSSRVRSLEVSRTKTLDAATSTLQRIERNLHDGTQAQLVALAMRLGQAKERLENIDVEPAKAADLQAIRRLVDEAHRGAKEAITDLRDLARGIHPPALDTGLENALATLAARSTIQTDVHVSVHSRPSPAIEAICYFCAAELLSNVAQHAEASRASLSCAQHGPWLRIVVRDDGRGGATVNRVGSSSSGLAGLADRVTAVDGHLAIASPSGGPTVVTVDLPTTA
jgi:signal transduction histidine kinase